MDKKIETKLKECKAILKECKASNRTIRIALYIIAGILGVVTLTTTFFVPFHYKWVVKEEYILIGTLFSILATAVIMLFCIKQSLPLLLKQEENTSKQTDKLLNIVQDHLDQLAQRTWIIVSNMPPKTAIENNKNNKAPSNPPKDDLQQYFENELSLCSDEIRNMTAMFYVSPCCNSYKVFVVDNEYNAFAQLGDYSGLLLDDETNHTIPFIIKRK